MQKFLFILVLLAAGSRAATPQGIRGEITDVNGDPVPYAAIFIKELTRGTTCNALGKFSLPLPAGEYTIFFRSLGYTEVSRTVTVEDRYLTMDIELPPQTYMIPEVRISASGEDPAYWIMRKAIGLANYHLHEVASYHAEIYIKGTAYIEKMPRAIARRIEVNDFKVQEDEAYMLESLNEVEFTAPDNYEMRVIASQNTLPGYTQNVNPMDYINASLYQQQIESVVSPLARNAFSFYRYKHEGTFMEGTHVINKIRVIPKRKSQQLVEGLLYIVEDLWCLHSSDLSVNTIAGTLYLQQLYANVIMDAWLPVNHKIRADIQIAGIKGKVTYVSSLEYSEVTLNPNLPETYFTSTLSEDREAGEKEEEPVSREQQKINELLQKEELTNRDVTRLSKLMEKEAEAARPEEPGDELNQTGTFFTVAENAVKNDSLFWNRFRPIPLTPEEQVTLQKRDSILGSPTPGARYDTTRTRRRRSRPFRDLMLGKTYRSKLGRFRFTHGGLLDTEMVGYNLVDGLYYSQDFRVVWRPDSLYTLRSRLMAGYAFHRKAPKVSWTTNLLYAPMARGKVELRLSHASADFNGASGIPVVTDMAYTLFLRQNHMKLYGLNQAELYNRIDLANGLELNATATWSRQEELTNQTDFSFLFTKARDFDPNVPTGLDPDDPALDTRNKLSGHIELKFTPRHYYVIRNYRKSMQDSDWPTFSIGYRHAFPLEESGWADFSELEFGIGHETDVGLLSELNWSVRAGYFLNDASVHFSDFRHVKAGPLIVDMAGFDRAFPLLDYYAASSGQYWGEAHARLTSSYLLLKYLPWFSERLWKESLRAGYVYTPAVPHHLQLGYSLEELFFLADVGIWVAFEDWRYKGVGARLNFRF